MAITTEDRLAIHELIGLHGHLMDAGDFGRLRELFSPDVIYDVEDFGFGSLQGIQAIVDASVANGNRNPIGHHVTNIILTELESEVVRAHSKGIGIQADGSSGSVTYEDVIKRSTDGWRITYRKVLARRTPLNAPDR